MTVKNLSNRCEKGGFISKWIKYTTRHKTNLKTAKNEKEKNEQVIEGRISQIRRC